MVKNFIKIGIIALLTGVLFGWSIGHNISNGVDKAFAITEDSNYIYIAGCDESPGDLQIRIQKRNKSDGSIVWERWNNISSYIDVILAITDDDNYIYTAGYDFGSGNYSQWRIEKRNKSDGSPVWSIGHDISNYDDYAFAITEDANYIYVAGTDDSPGPADFQFRIQKRNKSDGSIVWERWNNISSGYDMIYAITDDNDYIYTAGYDCQPGNDVQWRIEKRNKSDGSPVWSVAHNISSNYDIAYAITEDANYIYVAGYDESPGSNDAQIRIQKRSKSDGSIVWERWNNISTGDDEILAITDDDNYIYTAGTDEVPGNSQWRIEKRNKSDGSPVWVKQIDFSPYSVALGITLDNQCIYICGYDVIPGNSEWRIEKRRKSDGLSVNENASLPKEKHFEVFPNPFFSNLIIKTYGFNGNIKIYNVSGELVKVFPYKSCIIWNGENMPSGIYFIKIEEKIKEVIKLK